MPSIDAQSKDAEPPLAEPPSWFRFFMRMTVQIERFLNSYCSENKGVLAGQIIRR